MAIAALLAAGCATPEDPLEGLAGPQASAAAGEEPWRPTINAEFDAERVIATAATAEIVARSAPEADASVIGRFANPIATGGPLVFLVVGSVDGPWLRVLLPLRPNGTMGWIPADSVELQRNPYRIEIATAQHRLVVFRQNIPVTETTVAIGTGDTPTPIGSFYLTELLQPPDPDGPYGTYAFGLSGFSETLQSFNGGDGVIGIHGTNDPSSLGTDVSHGCVRLSNETIDELASYLPLGTPVHIR